MEPTLRLAFGVESSTRRYRLRLARYPALAETLAAFVRDAPATVRLLDAGVGRGRTIRYLAPHGVAGRVEFHGLDLEPAIAVRCHDRERWKLVLADVDRPLPYRGASFDAVVCEQVLEHVEDPGGALFEFARCLRPGGLLIFGVPTFPAGVAALRDRVAPWFHAHSPGEHGHVRTFTKAAAVALVRGVRLGDGSAAFDVREVRGFRSFSGGVAGVLEDFRWWWRLNGAFGRTFPSLCAEVQIVAVRREGEMSAAGDPPPRAPAARGAE